MKKIISLVLVMMLVFSLATVAFAAGETGSITINGTSESNIYEIYKLLDLESYNTTSGAYSYKVNAAWTEFFKSGTGALDYVAVSEEGYVTWHAGEDGATVAAFAKLALAFAKNSTPVIEPVKSSKNETDYTRTDKVLVFEGLELGYYLVDSTMGALCGLTTTNPNASINAKNHAPTIDKQVKEDGTEQWGTVNTADIGQIVEYRVTINVHAGAENYILHDMMEEGLTYQEVTKIEHVIPGDGTHVTPVEKYTVKTGNDVTDGCDFEIHFSQKFCDDLNTNDKVVVYYTAMLNRNAVIAGEGNINTAWLSYGEIDENHTTTQHSVKTLTYSIDIVKTDSQNMLIDGAQFKIYDAEIGGNEVAVVPLMKSDEITPVLDKNGNPMYRRARANETGTNILVKDGLVTVVGFDNGTYYLEEVSAPAGYNKLTARVKFIISDANLDATFNGNIFSTGSGVHVVNKTGSMLPETGAMGTSMFLFFGTFAVLAAGVLLVTKKRMSMIED